MKWETMFRLVVCACLLVASCGMDPTKPEAEKRGDGRSRPMADKTTIWYGTSGDGDWETAGNWSNGQPSTTGDNDTVIVSRYATSGMTTNLDRTADNVNGNRLAMFYQEPGSTVAIGSSSTPLKIESSSVHLFGSGKVFYTHESDSGAVGTMSDFIVAVKGGAQVVFDVGATADAITRVDIVSGYVTLKSTIPDEGIQSLYIGPSSGASAPTVIIEDPSSTAELLSNDYVQFGGTVFTGRRLCASATGSFMQTGGYLSSTGGNGDFQSGLPLRISGGYMNITLPTTITALFMGGGVVDVTQAGEMTITKLLRLGGYLKYDPALVTITTDFLGFTP